MKYLTNLDLNKNELQNAVVQNLSSAPSNPKAGQHYFNTTDHKEYVYDGTNWVDALSQGNYTFQNGVKETNRTVELNLASGANVGNVTLTANTNGLAASVAEASTSAKGIIKIATDEEAAAGSSEVLAVNPKQLATKVDANTAITGDTKTKITYDAKGLVTSGADLEASDIPVLDSAKVTTLGSYEKASAAAAIATTDSLNAALGKLEYKADAAVVANAAITAGTHTKITYDAKGLVTAGADLAESDIPSLHLSKVTDVTATAAEVNVLDGITASTAELNILDGVTADASELNILDGATLTTTELNYVDGVTSSIQDQLNSKIGLTGLSVASGSAEYMSYDNTKGEFSLNVDSEPTASLNHLVTSGGVKSYVDGKISTTYKAAGSVTFANLPTLGSDYEGYVYNVSDAFTTTADFVEGAGKSYPAGTNVVCINTAALGETPVYKWDVLAGFIDTSVFAVKGDIVVADFDEGVVQQSVRASASAKHTKLATEKAIALALDGKQNLVPSATANDIAFLDANGQVTDSGKAVSNEVRAAASADDDTLPTEAAVRAAIDYAAGAAAHKEVKAFDKNDATFADGQVVWSFANPFSGTDVIVQVKQSDNEVVIADVDADTSTIRITFNAEKMPDANAYKAVIIG